MRRLILVFVVVLAALLPLVGTSKAATSTPTKQDKLNQEPEMRFDIIRLSSTACEPLCPEWISAEGRIMGNTAGKLQGLLKNPANRKLPIIINSGGGSIESAISMARLIRKYQMTTAVGRTYIFGCQAEDRLAGKCKFDDSIKAYNGLTMPYDAYCASACPLMLLGGSVRVIEPYALIGLHEPRAESQPYIDHYRLLYRMQGGRKHIISKTFLNRTYLAKKEVIGITPYLRRELVPFLKDMGGDQAILTEMDKAAPKDMNWIKPNTGEREKLGLATNGGSPTTVTLLSLTSVSSCTTNSVSPPNCVLIKEKAPLAATSAPATSPPAKPAGGTCYIVGGCADPAIQKPSPAPTTKCFVMSGCS